MGDARHEVWITGIGIVSCLGEGPDSHWTGLGQAPDRLDTQAYPPYLVHPLAAIDFAKEIPGSGNRRLMSNWQLIGAYAAGLALGHAGIKGNSELLARTDLIVTAIGGDRDVALDCAVLDALPSAADPLRLIVQKVADELRPSLFLGQLPNLLAGSISIVHRVAGVSRTFLGTEQASVDAVRIAANRIAHGTSELALVGGAFSIAHPDVVMVHHIGSHLAKPPHLPVWQRTGEGAGVVPGSMGAFLVLESADHARGRASVPLAKLSLVLSDRGKRASNPALATFRGQWDTMAPHLRSGRYAVVSGASGAASATAAEKSFLEALDDVPVRTPGTHLGHGYEAQFPMNVALSALALSHGALFPPHESDRLVAGTRKAIEQVVVTSIGPTEGEGLALLETVQ